MAYAVAVSQQECLITDFTDDIWGIYHFDSKFISQIAVHPYIMVTCEPGDLHTRIGQTSKFTEKADESAGSYGAVFKPIVEYIS